MSGLLDYVKSFLTLFLLIKILLHLIPKNVFSKYIAFFSGLILAIGMLYPVMELLGMEETLLEKMEYATLEEELFELSVEVNRFEEQSIRRYEEVLKEKEKNE